MPVRKTSKRSRYKNPGRITNWTEYNGALEARGRVPIEGMVLAAGVWRSHRDTGERGRPEIYNRVFLEAILVLMTAMRMPLRQTRGMVAHLLRRTKAEIPSTATLCRHRQQKGVEARVFRQARALKEALDRATKDGDEGIVLIVDSTGISIRGQGTWRSDKPGSKERGRRSYWKLHTLVDPATGQIVAADLESDPFVSDPSVLSKLLDSLPQGTAVNTLAADGAYDTKGVYESLEKHAVKKSLVRPHVNAKKWKATVPGTNLRTPLITLGNRSKTIVPGSVIWRQRTGYSVRSLVETSYSRLAALGGNKPRSRSATGRTGEVITSLEILNVNASLGMPERYKRRWTPPPRKPPEALR